MSITDEINFYMSPEEIAEFQANPVYTKDGYPDNAYMRAKYPSFFVGTTGYRYEKDEHWYVVYLNDRYVKIFDWKWQARRYIRKMEKKGK